MKLVKKDTIAFVEENCIAKMLGTLLKIKGEDRKLDNKLVEYSLQLHSHNGCGFDTWFMLNILPCDRRIVDMIKNGKSLISQSI